MDATGKVLECIFRNLPRGSSIMIIPETQAVHGAVDLAADIMRKNWDINTYMRLDSRATAHGELVGNRSRI
jgi:hypothetical protein